MTNYLMFSEPANCSDGELRLVDGESVREGRVEVCFNGVWGDVCIRVISTQAAAVVCRQLGYNPLGMYNYCV